MDWAALIVFIVFGSMSAPFCIWQLGKILKDRRHDIMEEKRRRAEYQLQEMKLKAEIDSKILAGSSAVHENMTAEIQELREEVRRLKEQMGLHSAQTNTDYIR